MTTHHTLITFSLFSRRVRVIRFALVCLVLSLLPQSVHASSESQPVESSSKLVTSASANTTADMPTLSVTFSPVHLALSVFEVAGELRLSPKLSVVGIAGAGAMPAGEDLEQSTRVLIWELGAQGRYYVVGTFRHGVSVGAETMYVGADGDLDGVEVGANGLSIAPFVGYKYAASWGFTVDGQIGYEWLAMKSRADSGVESTSDMSSHAGMLLNLNLGWSF
ncbi:MAG: hypothetical protein Tsb0020_36450 [Haliangiales bacterium]